MVGDLHLVVQYGGAVGMIKKYWKHSKCFVVCLRISTIASTGSLEFLDER